MKLSVNRRFYDDFRGNRSLLTCLNSLNIKSEIWRQSPKDFPNFTAKHVVEFLLTAVHVDCGCDCSTPRLTVSIVPCNLKKKKTSC